MAAGDDDGQSFRVNFTGDGVGLLKERVKEKLREFMGDYTDDTLAEYVVVLLRNGRRKDEARNELNVFLGDDCVAFVAWLWDHLSSNLHLYAQAKEPSSNQVTNTKSTKVTLSGKNMQVEHVNGSNQYMDPKYDKSGPTNVSRDQRNSQHEGLGREEAHPYSLRSVVSEDFHPEENNNHRLASARKSRSPSPPIHRKRSRQDELQLPKRAVISHGKIDAPRRLLQFAVRDAVRTVQQNSPRAVPYSKRLRSVVSTAMDDSLLEERPLSASIPRASDFVGVPPKVAAEVTEDVRKVQNPGSVFDRLRHGIAKGVSVNQSPHHGTHVLQREYDHFDHIPEANRSNYSRNGHYNQEYVRDANDYEMARDSASNSDRYEVVSVSSNRGLDVSRSAYAKKVRDKLITPDADEVARRTGLMDHDSPASVPHKIVNIAVNVNTWKPQHHENSKSAKEEGNNIAHKKIDVAAGKPSMQLPEDVAPSDSQKDVQKSVTSAPGSGTAGRSDDDVDSRILFVSNVHFAASKDTLSRHFSRYGEVVKVIIATDAATGQPKGSAYVEFLQKEAAEDALSVNGTSFMSRILKVVRRCAAQHEPSQVTRRPGMVHASPYSVPRMPFPRGTVTSHFRGRLPMRPGARSLQWKREAPNPTEGLKTPQNAPVIAAKPIPTTRGRSLTYIRPGLTVESVPDVASLN